MKLIGHDTLSWPLADGLCNEVRRGLHRFKSTTMSATQIWQRRGGEGREDFEAKTNDFLSYTAL